MEPGRPEFVDSPSLNFEAGGSPARTLHPIFVSLLEPA